MVIVCTVWAIGVTVTLVHGGTPSAVVWAVPGATYALLAGGSGARRIRVQVDDGDAVEHSDEVKS
jgi:hypothetical protein